MASIAAEMIRQALEAFATGNADLSRQVLVADDKVDGMNREILAAMNETIRERRDLAPQALDVLLIARNLERIADHATNIAEDVIFWVRGADVRHGSGKQ